MQFGVRREAFEHVWFSCFFFSSRLTGKISIYISWSIYKISTRMTQICIFRLKFRFNICRYTCISILYMFLGNTLCISPNLPFLKRGGHLHWEFLYKTLYPNYSTCEWRHVTSFTQNMNFMPCLPKFRRLSHEQKNTDGISHLLCKYPLLSKDFL